MEIAKKWREKESAKEIRNQKFHIPYESVRACFQIFSINSSKPKKFPAFSLETALSRWVCNVSICFDFKEDTLSYNIAMKPFFTLTRVCYIWRVVSLKEGRESLWSQLPMVRKSLKSMQYVSISWRCIFFFII